MNPFRIFIVEDEVWYREILEYHLSLNPNCEVFSFATGKDCLNNLHKKPSVYVLDYSLPDITGKLLLKKLKAHNPDIPIIIVSGQEEIAIAVELLKDGAYDYIIKDNETKNRLWDCINSIKETFPIEPKTSAKKINDDKKYSFSKLIIGNSKAIGRVFNLYEKAIKSNITISITGETGTGKEMIAKAIHYNSFRETKPFVTVNVSAIPQELIESEMFGYEKGAFTGANSRRIGKFEEANKGTLFLDEVGDMNLSMQSKLLRVIQEREVVRVGGNTRVNLDVRIIVATHKDLAEEVKSGKFREDLYYRLLGLSIEMPSLRERDGDILLLAKHFVKVYCKENKLRELVLSAEAQSKLKKYSYPGNVRELKAIMELSCVMSDEESISESDIIFNSLSSMGDILSKEVPLREHILKIVKHYLEKYDNNVILVAKKLQIGKSTIYRMINEGEF